MDLFKGAMVHRDSFAENPNTMKKGYVFADSSSDSDDVADAQLTHNSNFGPDSERGRD